MNVSGPSGVTPENADAVVVERSGSVPGGEGVPRSDCASHAIS
jgi:hypothetical protein